MKHFESFLASVLMFVGVLFAGNVSAQTEPEWIGTAISTSVTNDGPIYLYNVGAKAFFVNGDAWGTQGALNSDYGLPIKNVTSGTGSTYRLETNLSTTEGTYLCLISGGTYNNYIFCDRKVDSYDGNVNVRFESAGGSNNEYYLSIGGRYIVANALTGNSVKGSLRQTTTTRPTSDLGKWIVVTTKTINEKLQQKPADLKNPTNITYVIKDPNLDRGSLDEVNWKLVDFTNTEGEGAVYTHTRANTPTSNRDYHIAYYEGGTYYFMTMDIDGNLGVTTDPEQAAVWRTSPSYHYFLCNGRYLTHTSGVLGTTPQGSVSTSSTSSPAYWTFHSSYGIRYGSGSSSTSICLVDGAWTLRNTNRVNLARPYTFTRTVVTSSGLKLGAQKYYKTAPDGNGEETMKADAGLDLDPYRTTWGKYFGAEARGVKGKFQQTVKVYYTGWYSVSCQGFYYNEGKENDVVSLFVEADGESRNQFLALGNTEGAVPSGWEMAAQALFPGNRYKNSVMFFVEMDNANDKGYDPAGKNITIGINWDEETANANDWTVFDDFQLQFMGYNTNLILEENVLNYDYLLNTEEEYVNSTLLLNRMFTANAWNTLVLPVNLTKNQFLTAFGANARIANLNEVKDGVLRFETITKSDKANDDVILEANKPYIVYIVNNPSVKKEYIASLTPKEGDGFVEKTIGGTATGAYYEVPFVTLDKANLAGVTAYTYGEGDASIVFNGTFVKTYEGTAIRPGFSNMKYNIIFKDGQLWWLDDVYGMKAYRAWLEPGLAYFPSDDTSTGAKISFEIDGVEDDATYIYGIFNESESTAEKFANGIYSINGMNMGTTSVDNLPKGIYIVNGKKYIVK